MTHKNGSHHEVIHWSESVDDSKAVSLVIRGYAESVLADLSEHRSVGLFGSARAVWMELGGRPVSVIAYYPLDRRPNVYWVMMSYTLPRYRRRGIWTRLWNALAHQARQDGFIAIESGVMARNTAMINACDRVGRKPVSITYRYNLGRKKS